VQELPHSGHQDLQDHLPINAMNAALQVQVAILLHGMQTLLRLDHHIHSMP
jgi:hypothetical protein